MRRSANTGERDLSAFKPLSTASSSRPRPRGAAPQIPQPAYLQIRDAIARRIATGDLRPGDRLPPERMLGDEFGVTRVTVRQAVLHLEGEGLVRRTKRGRRGWFVVPKPLRYDPAKHKNFDRNAREQGREPGFDLEGRMRVSADAELARLFGVERGTSLIRVSGVGFLDGHQVYAEEIYLLVEAVPGFLDRPYRSPLTDFVAEEFGLVVKQAGFYARSTRLTPAESAALDVVPDTPGLRLTRLKADRNGRIVQVDREAWIASAIEFVVGDLPD
jgi:DNA-binding GntR family transcriptional regulator